MARWEASDRICGKRLEEMIPKLLQTLERHGRLELGSTDRALILSVSASKIDRLQVDTKIAASGGRRRRIGFYSAIRHEVPIRTFNDWNDPPPGFCEVDMVAHMPTVATCHRQGIEQSWYTVVENREVVPARLVGKSAGEPTFPEPGLPTLIRLWCSVIQSPAASLANSASSRSPSISDTRYEVHAIDSRRVAYGS